MGISRVPDVTSTDVTPAECLSGLETKTKEILSALCTGLEYNYHYRK